MYEFPKAAIMKYHRLGGLNNSSLLFHRSGGLKSEMKGSPEPRFPEGTREGCSLSPTFWKLQALLGLWLHYSNALSSWGALLVCLVCPCLHSRLGTHLTPMWPLNYICNTISKSSHIQGVWTSAHLCGGVGRHSSTHVKLPGVQLVDPPLLQHFWVDALSLGSSQPVGRGLIRSAAQSESLIPFFSFHLSQALSPSKYSDSLLHHGVCLLKDQNWLRGEMD